MRHVPRALLAGGLGLAVSFLVACGGGAGLLSSDQASKLNGQLDMVSSAVQAGDCRGASSAVSALADRVAGLSGSLNTTLRRNLDQGASTVSELAVKDCHSPTSTPTTPSAPTTSSTSTHAPSTSSPATDTGTGSTPTTPPATTPDPGTTSTGRGTGGAGIGDGRGGGGASGGAGTGNGNGNGN